MNKQSSPTSAASKKLFWEQRVAQYRQSGSLSDAQFCREQSLRYQTFMKWLKKPAPQSTKQEQHLKSFIRIPASTTKPSPISCRLPNGIELSWDAATSATQVAAIICEVNQL